MTNAYKYFEVNTKLNQVIFIGDKLVLKIPKRYENNDVLIISDTVQTLGIFKMVINDSLESGIVLPAILTIEPNDISSEVIDGVEYVIVTLIKNDVFINNIDLIKVPQLAYFIFNEFITLGNMPDFISYNDKAFIFDIIKTCCDFNPGTNHVIYELIFAHLSRASDDLNIPYRFTNMTKPEKFIGLGSISFGPDSTSAKILGSYMNEGINSSLVNQSSKHSELEDLLRL